MVHLSKIRYIDTPTGGRLESDITIGEQLSQTIWVETSSEYKQYLTFERADAFVVGILNWAMREGHDIVSESPMGEYLYYQIIRYVIPGLTWGSPRLHNIKITCPIDSSELPNAGAVGTGITCGVDSLYSVCTNKSDEYPKHKITHLTFFNVGSHGEGERAKKIFKERLKIAQDFCKDNGYPLVVVDSNLHDVIHQNHFLTASYSAGFAIFALQKMWKLYHLASAGNDYGVYHLKGNDSKCSEDYEIFLLPQLSTDQLRIESSGAGVTRQNKLREIVKYRPSYKSLNVCTSDGPNCSRCEKCIRTMIGLDALGELDKYSEVFDLDFYRKNQSYCFQVFMERYYMGWKLHAEIYPTIKNKIPLISKLKARQTTTISKIKKFIKSQIKK